MRNRPYGFEIYLVNVKTIRTIAQIFVAFSEKLNFINPQVVSGLEMFTHLNSFLLIFQNLLIVLKKASLWLPSVKSTLQMVGYTFSKPRYLES